MPAQMQRNEQNLTEYARKVEIYVNSMQYLTLLFHFLRNFRYLCSVNNEQNANKRKA